MKLLIAFLLGALSLASAQSTARVTVPGASGSYVLGPGDQFTLEITDLEELNGKTHRVDNDGTVTLPLVGRIQAAGLTLPEFEAALDQKLAAQLKEPHITVTVTESLSQPVTVMGSVNTPGVQRMHGKENLAEVLSQAGGLKPDAGYRVTITRQMSVGDLPLAGARRDEANQVITGEVSLSDILEARKPELNIAILPHDLITVPRARVIYIVGEVRKSGGFTLEQKSSMSIIQALALAEGTTPTAAKNRALILRQVPGAPTRSEIPVDISKVMAGKSVDVSLEPDDILFVPNSLAKVIRGRAIETAVSTAAGVLIWRGL
ncbi:MAG: polysaccharide export protein [Acidobacteriota bacterium]|nr:polysaccharide export protein [Acidobacteriota bacterium]